MTKPTKRKRPLAQGTVDTLASGAIRVRVDGGVDPVTKKRHRPTEIVPAGPNAEALAEEARVRLLNQVHEGRSPRTNATVAQLLDRYLKQFHGTGRTRRLYRSYARNHVLPFIGAEKVGAIDADILDSLYAELQRCHKHCSGQRRIDHRTPRAHDCDDRCRPHKCVPLGPTAVRHIHFLLSGAYRRAAKWKWVGANPVSDAAPPPAPTPKPTPPTAKQAAQIVQRAWRSPEWGTLIWTAMTTGARRGEVCALRWTDVDLRPDQAVLQVSRAITLDEAGNWVEQETKTRQQRRVALDPETAVLLAEHRQRCEAGANALDFILPEDTFLFAADAGGTRFTTPDALTQRYARLVKRLRIKTTIHKLRHYTATELISGGVDVRTVAGRLGHSGSGTTTLRTYAAWVSEADQRAATNLATRMPARPDWSPTTRAMTEPEAPYERIAAGVRTRILAGEFNDGDAAPTGPELAAEHQVSTGTAHRALVLLREWGLVSESGTGRRATIIVPDPDSTEEVPPSPAPESAGALFLDVEIVRAGELLRTVRTEVDPNDPAELRQVLCDAVQRQGDPESRIGSYEMNLRSVSSGELLSTFVASARG